MSFKDLKSALAAGSIDKAAYIERMFEAHKGLFDYASLIDGTDIESIHIGQGKLRVKFTWPPIELSVPQGEMRAAPVEAINFGSYEKQEFSIVEKLVSSLDSANPLFIDIGGNVGFYSIGLKKLHPHLRIHAFEPVPATADQFAENCRLNDCNDISLHRCALSDSPGTATFYVHRRMSVAASQQNILGGDEMEQVDCQLVRLDDLAKDFDSRVDFIKCDVEGAELFAFRGGAQLIERDRPIVFSEMLRKWSAKFDYHPNDIIAFFKQLGYQCHALGDEGSRLINEVTESTLETNFIFLHTQRHEGLRLHS